MKRSTWIMLGVFVLLLGVWGVKVGMRTPDATPPPLDIEGYIGSVSEQDARSQAKDKPAPVTRISLRRADEEIVLERTEAGHPGTPAEGDKPAEPMQEARWKATRTAHGKTTEAKAQTFRAQSMAETLQRTIRSTYALAITPPQRAEYGLDPEHALDVELVWPKRTVKLRLGHLDKGQDIDSSTRPDVAYQVVGRDLRTSFDVTWSELRDRSLLTLDLPAVDKLTIQNPQDPKAKQVVLQRPTLTEAQRKDLADKKPGRDANEGWTLIEPAGVRVGDAGDWLRAIERLSAEEILDASVVTSKGLATGLQDPEAVRVRVGAGGQETVLTFGKVDEKSRTYASIAGRDEVYLLPAHNRDQVVQTLDQLRDRKLLGTAVAKDVTGVVLHGPDGEVEAERTGGQWTLVRPAGLAVSGPAVDEFLKDLEGTKVDFAEPATPSAVGLDTPATTLTLRMGTRTERVTLGKEVEGNAWGRVTWPDGTAETIRLTSFNARKLGKKPTDLADRKLLHVDRAAIDDVKWTPAEGPVLHLHKNVSGTWWLGEGEQVQANPEAVQASLTTLAGLEWKTLAAGQKAAGTGLDKGFLGIEVRAAGVVFGLRVSAQKTGDDVYAAAVEPKRDLRIVTVSGSSASALNKAAQDFKK
jgi:hypothetical protein